MLAIVGVAISLKPSQSVQLIGANALSSVGCPTI